MSSRLTGFYATQHLLASERGMRFNEWTQRVDSGGGSFGKPTMAQYRWDAFGWWNAAGTSFGTAEFFAAYSQLGFRAPAGYTAQHTVSLRLNVASSASANVALGPATAIKDGGAGNPGNCYFVRARTGGTIQLCKCTAGVVSVIGSGGGTVRVGNVLSLAYRWHTLASRAELIALLNGQQVVAANDASSPFNMAADASRPGLWGDDSRAIDNSLAVGEWSTEWWVNG